MKTSPRSSVLIDLAAIRHNVAHLLSLLSPGRRMLVAVKADAYGMAPCLWPARSWRRVRMGWR